MAIVGHLLTEQMDTVVEIAATAGYFKVSGIYVILNTVTGKTYVGSTANLKTRIIYHRSKLRHSVHDNSHLQRAWNLYGESNFKFFLVQKCAISELAMSEALWMRMLASCCRDHGYNLDTVAQHKMHCEETKKKIAESNRGKKFSTETRKRISAALTGTKHSLPKTPEQRKRYSAALMGHAVSEEARRKISAIHKGKTISVKHRQQISLAMKGRKFSPETIEKMKITNRRNGELGRLAQLRSNTSNPFAKYWKTA